MSFASVGRFVVVVSCLSVAQNSRAEDELKYNRDIRPILAENCFSCHGPDSASRKAGLRLDKRDAAIEKGAITRKEPDNSTLVERIFSDDPEVVMPPKAIHKELTAAQKDILKRWIADGAA